MVCTSPPKDHILLLVISHLMFCSSALTGLSLCYPTFSEAKQVNKFRLFTSTRYKPQIKNMFPKMGNCRSGQIHVIEVDFCLQWNLYNTKTSHIYTSTRQTLFLEIPWQYKYFLIPIRFLSSKFHYTYFLRYNRSWLIALINKNHFIRT